MASKVKIKQAKKIVKWLLIPIVLLVFWLGLSLLYFKYNFGISSLTTNIDDSRFEKLSINDLYKGDKIQGKFISTYNYLGLVLVRFNTHYRISSDEVVFRIRKQNEREWYYQNKYKVDQFQQDKFFTFGFPVIANSRGLTYEFEIISTKGMKGDAVSISTVKPAFVAKYQYPRNVVLSNLNNTLDFLRNKVINSLGNTDFMVASISYFLPFFFYFVYLLFFKKYLSQKLSFALIPFIILFIESFFVNNTNDIVVIVLTFIVIMNIYAYNLSSSITFSVAIFFLTLTPILFVSGLTEIAENFAMWAYLLLVVGVVQQIIELKWEKKELLGFSQLKKMYFK